MTSGEPRVAIVGGFGGAHIGGSLMRAAVSLQIEPRAFDAEGAWSGLRLVRSFRWRFTDRRPTRLASFSKHVADVCITERCRALIATGTAPLTHADLSRMREAGVTCINYSTDDPWNRFSSSRWFLHALPNYRLVATTRRANIDDLVRLGCRDVRYLPFGYDPMVHQPPDERPADGPDVLFVGGGDVDRLPFADAFMRSGLSLALVGGYWDRFPRTKDVWLGCKSPSEIRSLTVAAKVNVCLVRRANRDGHVMRSFEIPAIGACLIAEDSGEHRDIFGPDGEHVHYFTTPDEAVTLARGLVADPGRRARLSAAVRQRVLGAGSSYRDRLQTMMNWVQEGPIPW